MRLFAGYAGPSKWGPWLEVASHLGSVTYKIRASPSGDTVLKCRVKYFNAEQQEVIEEWIEDVTIVTGNSVAIVEVGFQGVPTGSAVEGSIDP